jgi:predicted metal-dependent enzyme (double-stranded beta helix superfamily)
MVGRWSLSAGLQPMMNFDVETFIDQCLRASRESDEPARAVAKVLQATIAEPQALLKDLPPSGEDEILLFQNDELTIYRVVVYPGWQYPPHDHGMPVVVGMYNGCETNVLYEHVPGKPDQIRAIGLIHIKAPHVRPLRSEVIHAVTNRYDQPTAALHVYMGDLSKQKRSLWTLDGDSRIDFNESDYFARARQRSVSMIA